MGGKAEYWMQRNGNGSIGIGLEKGDESIGKPMYVIRGMRLKKSMFGAV